MTVPNSPKALKIAFLREAACFECGP